MIVASGALTAGDCVIVASGALTAGSDPQTPGVRCRFSNLGARNQTRGPQFSVSDAWFLVFD